MEQKDPVQVGWDNQVHMWRACRANLLFLINPWQVRNQVLIGWWRGYYSLVPAWKNNSKSAKDRTMIPAIFEAMLFFSPNRDSTINS